MNNDLKTFINIISMFGILGGISCGSHLVCNWWGCYNWYNFMRTDMICNMCTDISYHLKNYHISLYASGVTLVTYKMTSLVNLASTKTDKILLINK